MSLELLQSRDLQEAPIASPKLRQALRLSSRRGLRCRACASRVTTESERIQVEGRWIHRRTNPAGFEFEFSCFVAAPGATTEGQPTLEHSWFRGYAWVFTLCGTCGAHLGWHFEGAPPSFHGLILNRLDLEEDGAGGDASRG